MTPRLSVVVPHWPLDEEVGEALRACLASLPRDCEKLVIVNDGTGFARNVNIGLRLATGDYVAVVTNDSGCGAPTSPPGRSRRCASGAARSG